MPLGDELSFTVAHPPASAVLVETSATAAATTSDFRTGNLLCSLVASYTARARPVPGVHVS
jgi:hypothetical protein